MESVKSIELLRHHQAVISREPTPFGIFDTEVQVL